MTFLILFFLYTSAIFYGSIKYEAVRYKLLLGYVFGLFSGVLALFFFDVQTAAIIATLCGLLLNVRAAVNVQP